eukprot:GHVS01044250.1.p3 GENE.GHVS01044250.1~~GHVS01044250.1.p3  ORF type:complete len:131 (+),score=4.76 GHVS01044250.1:1016-1408(+)
MFVPPSSGSATTLSSTISSSSSCGQRWREFPAPNLIELNLARTCVGSPAISCRIFCVACLHNICWVCRRQFRSDHRLLLLCRVLLWLSTKRRDTRHYRSSKLESLCHLCNMLEISELYRIAHYTFSDGQT